MNKYPKISDWVATILLFVEKGHPLPGTLIVENYTVGMYICQILL